MRIAILGTDPDVLALVAAAVAEGHIPVWLADLRQEDAAPLRALAPSLSSETNWEAVLDHSLADAVIVGAGTASEEVRLEQLKRLVADAIPTLSTYPLSTSVLPYFELDMVRSEVRGVLHHYNPIVDAVAAEQIGGWLRTGHEAIGEIRQIDWQRQVADRSTASVYRALARDCEALLRMAGDITKVSALGTRGQGEEFATLHAQMGTAAGPVITWAIVPNGDADRARMTLVGERGKLNVAIEQSAGHPANWCVEQDAQPLCGADVAAAAIGHLADAVAQPDSESPLRSTWTAATHAMEVVDAVQLSLQRGRTIEILHQHLTEQLAFRGVMSAFGCGLLVLGVIVLVLASVLGGTIGISFVAWWPVGLVALLVFFLLLQLVPHTRRRRQQ